jgi:hypothetical protein
MTNDTYYGIYMNHRDINTLLKRPVSRINDRCAARLRAAAATMEIPKSKLKQKLRFYILDDQEAAKLATGTSLTFNKILFNSECRPIISIKDNDIDSVYNRVNPFYPSKGMDPITHKQYKDDLEATFKPHIVKL